MAKAKIIKKFEVNILSLIQVANNCTIYEKDEVEITWDIIFSLVYIYFREYYTFAIQVLISPFNVTLFWYFCLMSRKILYTEKYFFSPKWRHPILSDQIFLAILIEYSEKFIQKKFHESLFSYKSILGTKALWPIYTFLKW